MIWAVAGAGVGERIYDTPLMDMDMAVGVVEGVETAGVVVVVTADATLAEFDFPEATRGGFPAAAR